jgi:hypothetical protein
MNASQRRSIEALLESLEDMADRIERLARDGNDDEKGMTHLSNDLPQEFPLGAERVVESLRAEVRQLSLRLGVSRRRISKRRVVRGMLSAQLIRVEDLTPARLRSYGELDPMLMSEVGPSLLAVRASIRELLALLQDQ